MIGKRLTPLKTIARPSSLTQIMGFFWYNGEVLVGNATGSCAMPHSLPQSTKTQEKLE